MHNFARNSDISLASENSQESEIGDFRNPSEMHWDPAATVPLLLASCILLPASLFFYFLLFFPSSL